MEYHIKYKDFPNVSPPLIATLQWPPLLCSHNFTTFYSKLISFYTWELYENFEDVNHLTYFGCKHTTHVNLGHPQMHNIYSILNLNYLMSVSNPGKCSKCHQYLKYILFMYMCLNYIYYMHLIYIISIFDIYIISTLPLKRTTILVRVLK